MTARRPATARHRHYSIRHRVVAWVSQRIFSRITYTVRHGLLTGMRRRGGLGFLPQWAVGRTDDTAEVRFWRDYPLEGLTIYDIGAFEGLLTMYFARRCNRVIAFEPHLLAMRSVSETTSS